MRLTKKINERLFEYLNMEVKKGLDGNSRYHLTKAKKILEFLSDRMNVNEYGENFKDKFKDFIYNPPKSLGKYTNN